MLQQPVSEAHIKNKNVHFISIKLGVIFMMLDTSSVTFSTFSFYLSAYFMIFCDYIFKVEAIVCRTSITVNFVQCLLPVLSGAIFNKCAYFFIPFCAF